MRKGSNGSIKSIRLLDYIEFSYILIAVREYKCDSPTSGCSAAPLREAHTLDRSES